MALLSTSAWAEAEGVVTSVKVRASDKGDYSRIVFDWGKTPRYTTQETQNGVVVTFEQDATFAVMGADPSSLSRVAGYKTLSPHAVEIDFSKDKSIRHFVMDNRLVIDIKGKAGKKQEQKPTAEKQPETQKENVPTPPKMAEAAALDKNIEASSGTEKELDAGKKDSSKPPESLSHTSAPLGVPPTVSDAVTENAVVQKKESVLSINITSTNSMALAAFERNGYLWIVLDKEGIKIPPQIEGEGGDNLGGFQMVPAVGTTVFRVRMPDGANPVATGGGLAWRIALQRNQNEKIAPKSLALKRTDSAGDIRMMLWPTVDSQRVADIRDPDVGERIYVSLQNSAKDFSEQAHRYVDFYTLPSVIGLAVVPSIDDVKVSKKIDGITISRPQGLNLSAERDIMSLTNKKSDGVSQAGTGDVSRIFDFANWQIGTEKSLSDNQRLIMANMASQNETKRVESVMSLARLVLSFGYAPETIGYMDLAQQMLPELENNPEFIALRAAAEVLGGHPKEAYERFSTASLANIGEIPYWKAYTLAKLDDWQQAAQVLPDSVSVLASYPDAIRNPLSITLAEVALRDGNVTKAKRILDILVPHQGNMSLPYAAAYQYLTGEYARQTGKPEDAKKSWEALKKGNDDLYRSKARFALTMLTLGAKDITIDKAIDNLEGLRYAWRGDDLEVSINNTLGRTYLEKGEPIKALTMMKMAHALNPTSEQGKRIDEEMRSVFRGLFTPEKIKNLDPVDAMTAYNEFSDLAPEGADGDVITRQLAERLVDVDLLPRATTILKKQIDSGIAGAGGASVAIRLATLQNMDGRPAEALTMLDKAELMLKDVATTESLPLQQSIGLLRAKAYSLLDKPDDALAALALLAPDEKILRLKADVAWRGKKWQDAADALEQLIQNQNITLTQPLTDAQADLILNWAVALYLADNRYVLANVRERYGDYMNATLKAQKFDVVTRPRQTSLLADRDTINSIVDETVIFKDFLKSFKTPDIPVVSRSAPPVAGDVPAQPSPPQDIPKDIQNNPAFKADDVLGD